MRGVTEMSEQLPPEATRPGPFATPAWLLDYHLQTNALSLLSSINLLAQCFDTHPVFLVPTDNTDFPATKVVDFGTKPQPMIMASDLEKQLQTHANKQDDDATQGKPRLHATIHLSSAASSRWRSVSLSLSLSMSLAAADVVCVKAAKALQFSPPASRPNIAAGEKQQPREQQENEAVLPVVAAPGSKPRSLTYTEAVLSSGGSGEAQKERLDSRSAPLASRSDKDAAEASAVRPRMPVDICHSKAAKLACNPAASAGRAAQRVLLVPRRPFRESGNTP